MITLDRTEPGRSVAAGQPRTRAVRRDVVVIEFPDVFRAHEAMLAAARMERRLSIVLNDAAVVTKDAAGKVRVNRSGRPSPVVAGLWAASWGWFLTFVFFGPWYGLVGASVAAGAAALWARRGIGLEPPFLRRIGINLLPGRAAGCFLVSHAHLAHVLSEVRRFEGVLLHSTVPADVERDLVEALRSG